MSLEKFVQLIFVVSLVSVINGPAYGQDKVEANRQTVDTVDVEKQTTERVKSGEPATDKVEDNGAAGKKVLTADDLKGLTPTQSYLKIHDFILQASSLKDFEACLTEENRSKSMARFARAKESGKEDLQESQNKFFQLMKMMLFPKVKVTSEKINGNDAVLSAIPLSKSPMDKNMMGMVDGMADAMSKAFTGKPVPKNAIKKEKSVTTGTIKMRYEDGVWKQHKEIWNTRIIGGGAGPGAFAKHKVNPWCAQTKEVQFARKPVAGKIGGKAFAVYKAEYNTVVNTLTLTGPGKDSWNSPSITLFLFNKHKVPFGQSFKSPSDSMMGIPHVHVRCKRDGKLKTKIYSGSDNYGLKLQFNKQPSNGKLSGYIVLRIPDKDKSEINGYFHATLPK